MRKENKEIDKEKNKELERTQFKYCGFCHSLTKHKGWKCERCQ